MKNIHNTAQVIVSIGIIFLCLQYTIVFDAPGAMDDSFKVVVEFKHLYQQNSALTSLDVGALPAGYRSMYQESKVYATESESYFVSKSSVIRGVRTDIERTFVAYESGRWNLHVVFKKEFTEKLIQASRYSDVENLAVIINSDLLATPISKDFLVQLNAQGEYELTINAGVSTKREAEEILDRYNM